MSKKRKRRPGTNKPMIKTEEARRIKPLQRAMLFIGLFFLMAQTWLYLKANGLKEIVIDTLTVKPAALLLSVIHDNVSAEAHILQVENRRLSVLNGCDGIDAMLLILAAVLATPARPAQKVIGVAAGVSLIYLINQVRIIGLAHARVAHPDWFHFIHGLGAPLFVIAMASLFYYFWQSRLC